MLKKLSDIDQYEAEFLISLRFEPIVQLDYALSGVITNPEDVRAMFEQRQALLALYLDEMSCTTRHACIALTGHIHDSEEDQLIAILTSDEAEKREYLALIDLYKKNPDRKHLAVFARQALAVGMDI